MHLLTLPHNAVKFSLTDGLLISTGMGIQALMTLSSLSLV